MEKEGRSRRKNKKWFEERRMKEDRERRKEAGTFQNPSAVLLTTTLRSEAGSPSFFVSTCVQWCTRAERECGE